ncbi:hypothetical protein CRG98_043360 [Punica granatum]|uniref:Zinc knuckle CX2CX4HX4C domain-containing protein n=1 Tax=Punica granatum TaxID=22663 RepID=A0A2I0HX30_PUNGR|nr:hypothetical protein CRG98_043360 [Punica granatum]
MESADLDNSLAEMFTSQTSMTHRQPALDLRTNDEETQEIIPLTLLIKPFGFKPPSPKAIIPRLLQAWNTKKGVSIAPNKYLDDILICLFKDERDMKYMEKEHNINKLVGKAGKALQIDWKDSPSLPKWYVTPRALVKILVTKSLYPGRFINRRSGPATWVFFKYEHLKTFCYDCGTIDHEQSHYDSESPAPPNLYGPWLRFDNQSDLLPPQMAEQLPLIGELANPQKSPVFDGDNHPALTDANSPLTQYVDSTATVDVEQPTVGNPRRADHSRELDFLHRSDFCPSPRKNSQASKIQPIFTNTIYSGLIEEQAQVEPHFQSSPGKTPSPLKQQTKPKKKSSPAHYCNIEIEWTRQAVQEDWNARRSASVEWEASSHLHPSATIYLNQGNSDASYEAHEMEDESIPEDIQMTKEAGLIKPPR